MKKILLGLVIVSLLVLPAFQLAQAAAPDVIEVIPALENITGLLFNVLIVVASLFIVAAAFHFVTAAGEPEKISKARDYVLYALVGVVVALLATGLVSLIETTLIP